MKVNLMTQLDPMTQALDNMMYVFEAPFRLVVSTMDFIGEQVDKVVCTPESTAFYQKRLDDWYVSQEHEQGMSDLVEGYKILHGIHPRVNGKRIK